MEQTGDNLSVGKRLSNGNVVVPDAYQNYFNKLDDKAKREALERLNNADFIVRRTEALNGSNQILI